MTLPTLGPPATTHDDDEDRIWDEEVEEGILQATYWLLRTCAAAGPNPRQAAFSVLQSVVKIVAGSGPYFRRRAYSFLKESAGEPAEWLYESESWHEGARSRDLRPYAVLHLLAYELRRELDKEESLVHAVRRMLALIPVVPMERNPLASLPTIGGSKGKKRQKRRGLDSVEVDYDVNDLVIAALCGDVDAIKEVLSRERKPRSAGSGGEKDMVNINGLHSSLGYTALHAACEYGQVDAARVLVEAGADVGAPCVKHGRTPLHYAARNTRHKMCERMLQEFGGNRKLTDWEDKRASDLVEGDDVLKDRLLDPPSRVAAIVLQRANPRSLEVTWNDSVATKKISQVKGYEVRWRRCHTLHSAESRTLSRKQSDHSHRDTDADSGVDRTTLSSVVTEAQARPLRGCEEEVTWSRAMVCAPGQGLRSWVIESLAPATAYEVTVTPLSGAGPGPHSQPAVYRTAETVPDAPPAPQLVRTSPGWVTLCVAEPLCGNGCEIVGYEAQFALVKYVKTPASGGGSSSNIGGAAAAAGDGGGAGGVGGAGGDASEGMVAVRQPWGPVVQIDDAATTFTISTPYSNNSMAQCVRLRCRNALGLSEPGEASVAFFLTYGIEILAVDYSTVAMSWTVHPFRHLTAFELQCRRLDGGVVCKGDDGFETVSVDIQEPRYTARVRPAAMYDFRVRACYADVWDLWGDAMYSAPVKTMNGRPDPPSAPRLVPGSMVGESVTLEWEPGRANGLPLLEFEVVASHKQGEWYSVGTVHGTVQHMRLDKLLSSRFYRFKAGGRNHLGWSDYGEESDCIELNPVPPPSTPTLLQEVVNTCIVVTFDPPPGVQAEYYELRYQRIRRSNNGPLRASVGDVDMLPDNNQWETFSDHLHTNRVEMSELRPQSVYCLQVRAMTVLGWSRWSASAFVETKRRH